MSEKTVVITETAEGKYKLQNNGLSEFALIGILECLVFDLKTATTRREAPEDRQQDEAAVIAQIGTIKESDPPVSPPAPVSEESVQEAKTTDMLRTRIGNAVKAIRSLGGKVTVSDLSDATDDELQTELEELTNQYKRLKSSKGK